MSESTVERAARAAYEKRREWTRIEQTRLGFRQLRWDELPAEIKRQECEQQRAAIAALREPSDEMLMAATGNPSWQAIARAYWTTMIDQILSEHPQR